MSTRLKGDRSTLQSIEVDMQALPDPFVGVRSREIVTRAVESRYTGDDAVELLAMLGLS